MHITILAASGATGRQLAVQALERGHTVTALARHPDRLDLPGSDRLRRAAADVRDPSSIARALTGADVVVSGLGSAKGDKPGTLSAGAHAVLQASPDRIIWLGALGTGPSAQAAGALTRTILKVALRAEITDKNDADTTVLDAGGTLFHAGPLTHGSLSTTRRTITLANLPRRLLPARVSRATVAAAMLDEAESALHPGQVLIPLSS